MAEKDKPKSCFIIAPIGDEGSEIRERSDIVLEYVILPVVAECGYTSVTRADRILKPGMITSDIVQHLLDDDLVVADLTGSNANVFYELAIRHAIREPVVQIIDAREDPPFDVKESRTIKLDLTNPKRVDACKQALEKQIREAEKDPGSADNPISQAIDLLSLSKSGHPLVRSNAEIIALLRVLLSRIAEVKDMLRPIPYIPPPTYVPVTGAFPPPGQLSATLAQLLSETRGAADLTGPSGPVSLEGATGPTGAPGPTSQYRAVGPLGPSEPPADTLRGAANPPFSRLAGGVPPSGAFPSGAFPPDSPAEAKKLEGPKRKDADKARKRAEGSREHRRSER